MNNKNYIISFVVGVFVTVALFQAYTVYQIRREIKLEKARTDAIVKFIEDSIAAAQNGK